MTDNLKEQVNKYLRLTSLMLPSILGDGSQYDISEQGEKVILSVKPNDENLNYEDAMAMIEDDAEMYILADCQSKNTQIQSFNYGVAFSKPEPNSYNMLSISSNTDGIVVSVVIKIYTDPGLLENDLQEEREFCGLKYNTNTLMKEEDIVKTFVKNG